MKVKVSSKFKLSSQLGVYEGKIDPMDHLDSYKNLMMFQGYSEVMCKAFSATLKGSARSWFKKLSLRTIDSFGYLSRLFVANFMSFKVKKKNASHLITIHQEGGESLKDYSKANKYIVAEELVEAKHRRRGRDDHKRKEPDTRLVDYRDEVKCKRSDRDTRRRTNDRHPRTPPHRLDLMLPPLNAPIAQVLMEIKNEEFVKWTAKGVDSRLDQERVSKKDLCGGCLSSSHKRHATKASERDEEEVYNLPTPMARAHQPITFTNDDLRGFHLPHDDALVISATIANFNIQRILVDNRSSADILFVSAFDKMKIGRDRLHPFHTPLVRFGGSAISPFMDQIALDLWGGTLLDYSVQDFIVVDCHLPYNAILGRPPLGKRQGHHVYHHLMMKFPTSTGISEALEEVTPIPIHPDYPDHHVMIETKLNEELRNALVEFLKENYDVLAWSQGDILGIDPQIAVHKLLPTPTIL
ncbi:hypothetical protein Acr_10g0008310 [Actinidia rufa]|uniref:Retrotransposon gag domain-containing protein n=1 Tax=Actinidia rufa TaxID=165716 RepID=A0A7J0FAJ4_9ERIC|nr:hypothetical protein Acr_10g0008310 [Actinidia rufa]